MTAKEQYERVAEELSQVIAEAGRKDSEVCLVAVSKTVGVDAVKKAIEGGAHNFGENRPEGILEKYEALPQENWHFIGNIQSRRIRDIVPCSVLIHSVFDLKHARKIDSVSADLGKIQDILLEVNVSGEASKSGLVPSQVEEVLDACEDMKHIRVRGLMTMAPQGDLRIARETFEDLAALKDTLSSQLSGENKACFDQLSMGMSEDWREAIHAGATIVRIGRAIFDENFQ
ncbi:MAG: YggS family pyridoxal phosphate-dependent enzyme [Eggerthellaceae bacterium]